MSDWTVTDIEGNRHPFEPVLTFECLGATFGVRQCPDGSHVATEQRTGLQVGWISDDAADVEPRLREFLHKHEYTVERLAARIADEVARQAVRAEARLAWLAAQGVGLPVDDVCEASDAYHAAALQFRQLTHKLDEARRVMLNRHVDACIAYAERRLELTELLASAAEVAAVEVAVREVETLA